MNEEAQEQISILIETANCESQKHAISFLEGYIAALLDLTTNK